MDVATGAGTPATSIETIDGALARWAVAGATLESRPLVAAAASESATRVLVTGAGDDGLGGATSTAEIFTP